MFCHAPARAPRACCPQGGPVMSRSRLATLTAAMAALCLGVAGCATSASSPDSGSPSSGGGSVKVAVLTSKTGPLASYSAEYLDGFKAGLDYATHGSGK